jgi:integrase
MPKINKNTLKVLPRNNIRIYKFENKQTYFCSFYVGTIHFKSGKFERSTKTKNINEAISKANELYRNWFIKNPSTLTKKYIDFDLDIAQPWLRYRVNKYKNKTHLKNNEQGERDRAKWENFLKPYFDDVDYKDFELVETIINDQILSDLKDLGKSGNTINKYMSVLNQMFKRAKDRGIINVIPDTPTELVMNTPRHPYTNQELNLINRKCDEEYSKKEDKFYLELKDYFNLCRSGGFRPGLEVLNIKKRDFQYLTDAKNPKLRVLEFTVYNTKTKPTHKVTCNPFFTDKIFPEILERNSIKDDDYLLFPNEKNRNNLKNKVGKIFTRLSKELGLYYFKDGGTRPIYSIRHTYATELYKKGVTIQDIATSMNTSERMIMSVYLGLSDQTLVERHKRVYGNMKIVK